MTDHKDIVDALRWQVYGHNRSTEMEAADLIEAQASRIVELEGALRDLVDVLGVDNPPHTDIFSDDESVGWTGGDTPKPLPMTFGHVRRARAALTAIQETK